ncbi:hypothetical protein BaRGS_00018143 [Batillaria attramentaria]|uniref:Uncharacterized protein n=1 Tax=Batillaria attramentaria TaxID=370345 RepID=A0ABD0KUN9_9CAEN
MSKPVDGLGPIFWNLLNLSVITQTITSLSYSNYPPTNFQRHISTLGPSVADFNFHLAILITEPLPLPIVPLDFRRHNQIEAAHARKAVQMCTRILSEYICENARYAEEILLTLVALRVCTYTSGLFT